MDNGENLDGKPLEDDLQAQNQAKFARSKWETVDEAELEAQGKLLNIACNLSGFA